MTIAPGAIVGGDQQTDQALIRRLCVIVSTTLVPDATVLVATGGDGGLLDLGKVETRHFPEAAGGEFRWDPISDSAAMAHLDELRGQGAAYFLIPDRIEGWVAGHREFERRLEEEFEPVTKDDNCVVFDLRRRRRETLNELLESLLPVDVNVILIGDVDPDLELPGRHLIFSPTPIDELGDDAQYVVFVPGDGGTEPMPAAALSALRARCKTLVGRPGLCDVFQLREHSITKPAKRREHSLRRFINRVLRRNQTRERQADH